MGRASFHRLAERELYDAVQYYDLESPGLGAAFLSEVDRCVQTILRYPEAGPVILGAVRLSRIRCSCSRRMNWGGRLCRRCGGGAGEGDEADEVSTWLG